jgi:3-methyladenine DNA glycosylase AlkD
MRGTTLRQVLRRLKSLSHPENLEGMARFAIPIDRALGITTPDLKKLAREIGRNHSLAVQLWATKILEARGLAVMIEEPERVTEAQIERWVKEFDGWSVCDGCCLHLIRRLPFAWPKAFEWSRRRREFEKRAGFALAAALGVHDQGAPDDRFLRFLAVIKRQATDERNFVKKAVNWALRVIGKRNRRLNRAALRTAREIQKIDSHAARWIAADALRELSSDAVRKRLRRSRAI